MFIKKSQGNIVDEVSKENILNPEDDDFIAIDEDYSAELELIEPAKDEDKD